MNKLNQSKCKFSKVQSFPLVVRTVPIFGWLQFCFPEGVSAQALFFLSALALRTMKSGRVACPDNKTVNAR